MAEGKFAIQNPSSRSFPSASLGMELLERSEGLALQGEKDDRIISKDLDQPLAIVLSTYNPAIPGYRFHDETKNGLEDNEALISVHDYCALVLEKQSLQKTDFRIPGQYFQDGKGKIVTKTYNGIIDYLQQFAMETICETDYDLVSDDTHEILHLKRTLLYPETPYLALSDSQKKDVFLSYLSNLPFSYFPLPYSIQWMLLYFDLLQDVIFDDLPSISSFTIRQNGVEKTFDIVGWNLRGTRRMVLVSNPITYYCPEESKPYSQILFLNKPSHECYQAIQRFLYPNETDLSMEWITPGSGNMKEAMGYCLDYSRHFLIAGIVLFVLSALFTLDFAFNLFGIRLTYLQEERDNKERRREYLLLSLLFFLVPYLLSFLLAIDALTLMNVMAFSIPAHLLATFPSVFLVLPLALVSAFLFLLPILKKQKEEDLIKNHTRIR